MMIYNYDEIQTVHLEVTDKCNATCPMCARNNNGGSVNPYLSLTELSVEQVKAIFPVDFVKQLRYMFMCGNYGDPVVAKDTLEIFKYFRENNPEMKLSMNTNASARKEEWWIELAEIIGTNGNVKFDIDGLEDTHSLYRKGTDYDKIIKNARAFIDAGGKAFWEYLVFGHNEHQVDKARQLSKEYGFEKFTVKKTGRFFSNAKMEAKGYREVLGKDNKPIYNIYPPTNPDLQNKSLAKEQSLINQYGSMEQYLDDTKIVCKVEKEKHVYVSAEGYIFPCCWLGNQMYIGSHAKAKQSEIWDVINKIGGLDEISAITKTIKEIVEGPFFEEIENSWELETVKCGKLKTCAKTCGQQFDQFKDQYK